MQIIKIDNSSGSELYAGDFIRRCTRARVVPRADNQKMFCAHF